MVPLGQHLGADKDAGAAFADGVQLPVHDAFAADLVAVETQHRHTIEPPRERFLELLRALARAVGGLPADRDGLAAR